jgi:hypothetical protein
VKNHTSAAQAEGRFNNMNVSGVDLMNRLAHR